MSLHAGHRERMRERFRKDGLTNFAPHEVLEILLYYCVPRHDTNAIGHKLIKRFKTLNGVFHAPVKELEKIEGIGPGTAEYLKLVGELCQYAGHEQDVINEFLCADTDYNRYFRSLFTGKKNELLYLLCLDAKCMVIDHFLIAEGSVNYVNLPVRKIVDIAITANAASVVLAHNHPGGFALPSGDDIQATINLGKILKAVDVTLVDHLIFAQGDSISMARSGMYCVDEI